MDGGEGRDARFLSCRCQLVSYCVHFARSFLAGPNHLRQTRSGVDLRRWNRWLVFDGKYLPNADEKTRRTSHLQRWVYTWAAIYSISVDRHLGIWKPGHHVVRLLAIFHCLGWLSR